MKDRKTRYIDLSYSGKDYFNGNSAHLTQLYKRS